VICRQSDCRQNECDPDERARRKPTIHGKEKMKRGKNT
jgi:hypothetical protein